MLGECNAHIQIQYTHTKYTIGKKCFQALDIYSEEFWSEIRSSDCSAQILGIWVKKMTSWSLHLEEAKTLEISGISPWIFSGMSHPMYPRLGWAVLWPGQVSAHPMHRDCEQSCCCHPSTPWSTQWPDLHRPDTCPCVLLLAVTIFDYALNLTMLDLICLVQIIISKAEQEVFYITFKPQEETLLFFMGQNKYFCLCLQMSRIHHRNCK